MPSLRIWEASHQRVLLCQAQHKLHLSSLYTFTSPAPGYIKLGPKEMSRTGNKQLLLKHLFRGISPTSHYTPLCSAVKKRGTNNNCCKSQPSHLSLGSSPHCLYPGGPVSALPVAWAISSLMSLTAGPWGRRKAQYISLFQLTPLLPLPLGPFALWERCVLDLARSCERLSHVCWWKLQEV